MQRHDKRCRSMIKDEKGGKIMIKFVALKAKMYAHKMIDKTLDDNS